MTLKEMIDKLQSLREVWEDDTEIVMDFDAPQYYTISEVDDNCSEDYIVIVTHPWRDPEDE